jgi:hypothetical protein
LGTDKRKVGVLQSHVSGWIDCESYESALASLAGVYGVSSGDIKDYLSCFDLDKEYEKYKADMDAGDLLQIKVDQKFGGPQHSVTGISWFHLTRTLGGTTFSEGILPLDAALPKLWDMLVSIPKTKIKKRRLEELRTNGVPNYLYNLKTPHKLHHGPYAMLVRESAFNASEIGNHDYLKLPEIIEDICWGYQEKFKESIQAEIMAALRPCIVKFEDRSGIRTDVIDPVIRYCHCKAWKDELHIHTNTCFDGQGEAVPFEAIQRIEYVDPSREFT